MSFQNIQVPQSALESSGFKTESLTFWELPSPGQTGEGVIPVLKSRQSPGATEKESNFSLLHFLLVSCGMHGGHGLAIGGGGGGTLPECVGETGNPMLSFRTEIHS